MSDTPETDEFYGELHPDAEIMRGLRDHARSLERRALAAEAELKKMKEWLDSNTTFHDSDGRPPVLFGRRFWYHMTDDTQSYPFTAVIDAARKPK